MRKVKEMKEKNQDRSVKNDDRMLDAEQHSADF